MSGEIFIHLPIYHLSTYLPIRLPIYLSVYLFFYLFIKPSGINLLIYVCTLQARVHMRMPCAYYTCMHTYMTIYTYIYIYICSLLKCYKSTALFWVVIVGPISQNLGQGQGIFLLTRARVCICNHVLNTYYNPYTHNYTHTYVYICIYTRFPTHIHTYIHTYLLTYIHIYNIYIIDAH